MARSFNGGTDGIQATSTIAASILSYCGWFYFNSLPSAYGGCAGFGGGSSQIYIKSSGKLAFYGFAGSVDPGSISISTGAWYHIAIANRNLMVNGAVDTTFGGDNATGAATFTAGYDQGTAGRSLDAYAADVAIWDVGLTTEQVATLAKGYSPLFVSPNNLILYWPLIGRASPEIDVVGGNAGTLTGTSAAPHPRIIMPRRAKVKRYRPVVVANIYVYMRPDADQSDGSWLNELGSNVDLYASVDETVASDTDYIQSSTTSGDKVRLRLSNPGAAVAEPFAIRYRASATTGTASIYGRLYQGASTLIDSWNHTVDTTPTNYTHTLGTTEFSSISDFDDLFIEFEYVP